jgi:hypothetical protein
MALVDTKEFMDMLVDQGLLYILCDLLKCKSEVEVVIIALEAMTCMFEVGEKEYKVTGVNELLESALQLGVADIVNEMFLVFGTNKHIKKRVFNLAKYGINIKT